MAVGNVTALTPELRRVLAAVYESWLAGDGLPAAREVCVRGVLPRYTARFGKVFAPARLGQLADLGLLDRGEVVGSRPSYTVPDPGRVAQLVGADSSA